MISAAAVTDGDVASFLQQNLNDPQSAPKPRRGVVIRGASLDESRRGQAVAEPPAAPSTTKALVIFATRQRYEGLKREEVQRNSRQARALDLQDTSYFYARNIRLVERSKLTKIGRAPPDLYLRLSILAEQGLLELAPPELP
jgi:hypothetical protein